MHDGIYLANVCQELITQTLALAGALYKASNVHKLESGRENALWLHQFGQLGQAVIGYIYLTHVWFYGAEPVVGSLCLCTVAHRIE